MNSVQRAPLTERIGAIDTQFAESREGQGDKGMWTEQTVETLKKFALEGRSASWIAAALGAPSRNAVIGKANRIGVKLNGIRSASFEQGSVLETPSKVPWGRRRRPRPNGEEPGAERRPLADIPWRGAVSRARSRLRPLSARGDGRSDGFSPPPRWVRCGGSGSWRSERSSADGRSAIRRWRTSPFAVFRSPGAALIARDTVGWPIAFRTAKIPPCCGG
jgi:hypothetical protein